MSVPLSVGWKILRDSLDEIESTPRNITVDPDLGIGVGKVIYATHWNSIVKKAEDTARYCSCHCNYCTCQCNYCTCDCNYCTCNCAYCTCDCAHCSCNCDHRCICDCAY